jgi:pimeloyl-ACP methyl ester carboxylesterase
LKNSVYRDENGRAAIVEWCEGRLAGLKTSHDRRTLDTGLGTAHITTLGTAGPTVVLLPGTNFNIASWLELAVALADEHRVIAIDLPGQPGLSDPERHRHAHDLYGVWLAETLKELQVGDCTLVGHSLGARVALAASVHVPGAQGIVAFDPAGIVRLRISAAMLLVSGRWFRRKDEASSRALLSLMTARGFEVPEPLVEWMTLVGRHTRTTLAPPTLPPARLKAIAVPTRVLIGDSDVFLPQRRVRWGVRKLKNIRVQWVENAGHLMPLEHPDVVVRAVKEAVSI